MRRAASSELSARLLASAENAKLKSPLDPSKDYELKEKLGTGSFGPFCCSNREMSLSDRVAMFKGTVFKASAPSSSPDAALAHRFSCS